MTGTSVYWHLKGQTTRRGPTWIPDGEDYRDWIAKVWGVESEEVVVDRTERIT
jgi:hypothetical protein